MLLSMLHVGGDMAWFLGCAVVVIGQPVLHHHIILHGLVQRPPSTSILCCVALH